MAEENSNPQQPTPGEVAHPQNAPQVVTQPQGHGEVNGLAIAAMIVGIIAFISGWIPFWGLLVGATAVVLGAISLRRATGKGFAITGIITGGLGALASIIFSVIALSGFLGVASVADQLNQELENQEERVQGQLDGKKDFTKGETGKFGEIEVKINSVQRDWQPESEYMRAEDGKEYIVLNVTIKNVGKESEYVSGSSFKVNEAGVADYQAFVTIDGELEGGSVSAGASTTGNIVYEVTKGATDLKIQYETFYYSVEDGSGTLTYTLAF